MIEIRPFDRLGAANHGWLDAKHHFSFADYRDHDRMNWGRLRVWNDDTIDPGSGLAVPDFHRDTVAFETSAILAMSEPVRLPIRPRSSR